MSLQTKVTALAQAIGTDVKALYALVGDLTALNITPDVSTVVAALLYYEGEIDALISSVGVLSNLTTTAKSNLVAAINEVKASVGSAGAQINDTAGAGATTVTWSADKITSSLAGKQNTMSKASSAEIIAGTDDVKYTTSLGVAAAIAQAVANLVASAPGTLDTLNELAAALGNDPNYATTIATALTKRIRVDAVQTFTTGEKLQACQNLGLGDPETDYVSVYNTAKA